MLLCLGKGPWADFYNPAARADEISLVRPFYPRAPGGTSKQQLLDALGVGCSEELLRLCDRPTAARGKACEIFWTLGANQVGRAAIHGWRDLLAPAVGLCFYRSYMRRRRMRATSRIRCSRNVESSSSDSPGWVPAG